MLGTNPANICFSLESKIAAVPHADALVLIVRVGVIAVAPETVLLGIEKHKSGEEGLLETAQLIVPVYPFCGVIVTVDVPELPAATVAFAAARVKLFVPVDEPLHIVNKLLKSIEPRPVARS